MTSVYQRWMIRGDMERVLEIEREAFEFPWHPEDFIRCLREKNVIGMVAEAGTSGTIAGFMIYELHKTRLHLLNIAVASEFRRRGVGRQMLGNLIGKLSKQRRVRMSLEVREKNLAAQLFFQSSGFRAQAVLRDFYEDTEEAAYLMILQLDQDYRLVNRIAAYTGDQP